MRPASLVVLLISSLAVASSARAQAILGPSKCVACHDHEKQANKWQRDEPAQLKEKAHFNTRKQLEGPKAAGYARAIGLSDPFDIKGACVKCHATVFRGDAGAGVSCESCHGAASAYLDPHQVKGAYAKAVATGLRDLRGKPAAIAKLCVDCHVTPDARLAAAGHPTGAAFDAGVSLGKLVHWAMPYDFAKVTAEGRTAMAGRVPAAGAAPPAVRGAATPAGGAAGEPAPWDWDAPLRTFPESGQPAATRSLAEDQPLPQRAGAIDLPPAVESAAVGGKLAARPPAADVAALRGQAAQLLERLLRAGARAPGAAAPARPAEFPGPDGELLRLQDEALALALEALRGGPK
jgi:hypothetical protein